MHDYFQCKFVLPTISGLADIKVPNDYQPIIFVAHGASAAIIKKNSSHDEFFWCNSLNFVYPDKLPHLYNN
jgi:hypothetical protein